MINNNDFLDVSLGFENVKKELDGIIKKGEELANILKNDVKKAFDDLAKAPTGDKAEHYEKLQASLTRLNKELKAEKDLKQQIEAEERKANKAKNEKIILQSKEYSETRKLIIENQKRKRQIDDEIKFGKIANDSLRAKSQRLNELKTAYSRASAASARTMLPEIKKLDKEVKNLSASIGNNQGRVGSYMNTLKKAVVSMGAMYLSVQGLRRIFSSTNAIVMDFEKAMSGVAAISGATGAELKNLEEDAKRLGATTNKTASEVAQLQMEFAKLGFTTQEILDATEATVLLSQATGEDLAKSAAVAGATIRGFGMDASETGRVVDIMAASFTSSALNLDRFSEAMKYVAPVAKASGISIEQTAAMMSKLADAGIHGSMAGTALRKIMLEMAKAGKTGADGLMEMARSGISLADANDEVGQRAATALLILSEQKDAVNLLTDAYENSTGAAEEMARVQMDNLAGAVQILKSAWEGFVLEMSKGINIKRRVIDMTTSLVGWLTRNADIIRNVSKAVGYMVTAWAAYRATLILTNSQLGLFIAGLFAKNTQTSLATARTIALTKAQTALNTVMRMNPYALVASLLAVVVVRMVSANKEITNAIHNTQTLKEQTQEAISSMVQSGKTQLEAIQIEIKNYEAQLNKLASVERKAIEAFNKAAESGDKKRIASTNEWVNNTKEGIKETSDILNDLRRRKLDIENALANTVEKSTQAEVEVTEFNAKELIKRLEQIRDFEIAKLKLQGTNNDVIKRREIEHNKDIQTIRERYGMINQLQLQTALMGYEKELNDLDKKTEDVMLKFEKTLTSAPKRVAVEYGKISLWSRLLSPEEFQDLTHTFTSGMDEILSYTTQKWERLVHDFNTKISEANESVNRELMLKSQGLANEYDKEKERLTALQQQRDDAVQREKENNIMKLRLNQAEKVSNIGVAISELFKADARLGSIGIATSVISLGVMVGAIAAAESQIQQLKKYRDGGLLEGDSHENGGVLLVNKRGRAIAEAEGGEYIINKKATQESPIITEMINNHKITDREILPALRMQRELKLQGINENTSATKELTKAISTSNDSRFMDGWEYRKVGSNLIRRKL